MSAWLVPEVPRLRCDRVTLARLMDFHERPDERPWAAELTEAGLVVDGAVHPALAPVLAATDHPTCLLTLEVLSATDVQRHAGWLAPEGVVLVMDLEPGTPDLVMVPTATLSAAIARLAMLGPRKPVDREPRWVGAEVSEGWHATDPGVRRRAFAASGAPEGWVWSLALARGGEVLRRLRVLDGPRGAWRAEREEDGALLVPTTATEVWGWLNDLLPTDAELGL